MLTRRTIRRLRFLVVVCSAGVVLLGALQRPVVQISTHFATDRSSGHRIRLDRGLFSLYQELPVPRRAEVALRIWVQRLAVAEPYITVGGASGQRWLGRYTPALPPADGQFHAIQLPWWLILSESESVSLDIMGHGVLLQITASDEIPGASLEVSNGKWWPDADLVVEVVTRREVRFWNIPVLGIAKDKPGVLGSPYTTILLAAAYITIVSTLVLNVRRLQGLVPRASARRDDEA